MKKPTERKKKHRTTGKVFLHHTSDRSPLVTRITFLNYLSDFVCTYIGLDIFFEIYNRRILLLFRIPSKHHKVINHTSVLKNKEGFYAYLVLNGYVIPLFNGSSLLLLNNERLCPDSKRGLKHNVIHSVFHTIHIQRVDVRSTLECG